MKNDISLKDIIVLIFLDNRTKRSNDWEKKDLSFVEKYFNKKKINTRIYRLENKKHIPTFKKFKIKIFPTIGVVYNGKELARIEIKSGQRRDTLKFLLDGLF